MKLFLVSAQDDFEDLVENLIKKNYSGYHMRLNNRKSPLWVIAASNENTPASVAESLNMPSKVGQGNVSGMVVQISSYYGYDSMALWQQLDLWQQLERWSDV